jgi:hypothetical protein
MSWEIEIFKWEAEPYRVQCPELWEVLAHVVPVQQEISHFEVYQIGNPNA